MSSCHCPHITVLVSSCHCPHITVLVSSCHCPHVTILVSSCHCPHVTVVVSSCHRPRVIMSPSSCHHVSVLVSSCHRPRVIMSPSSCHHVNVLVSSCHRPRVIMSPSSCLRVAGLRKGSISLSSRRGNRTSASEAVLTRPHAATISRQMSAPELMNAGGGATGGGATGGGANEGRATGDGATRGRANGDGANEGGANGGGEMTGGSREDGLLDENKEWEKVSGNSRLLCENHCEFYVEMVNVHGRHPRQWDATLISGTPPSVTLVSGTPPSSVARHPHQWDATLRDPRQCSLMTSPCSMFLPSRLLTFSPAAEVACQWQSSMTTDTSRKDFSRFSRTLKKVVLSQLERGMAYGCGPRFLLLSQPRSDRLDQLTRRLYVEILSQSDACFVFFSICKCTILSVYFVL